MKLLTHISRIIVGALFVFSGWIKLNDPLGFSYKLDEYFSTAVLGLEFLQPYVLPMAIGIVIFEVLLGVMLILGYQVKFTLWSLLLMIIFFTFLTFYSAAFDKVTDCGCFGDAIPLTPWQSFYKDVLLLVLIVVLFINRAYILPLFAKAKLTITILLTTIACFIMAYHVLMHLPLIDFRAYKIGVNILENMADDPSQPDVYAYDWHYTIDGKPEIVTTDGLPPEGYPAYDQVIPRLVTKGYEPPIHDFAIESNGTDITADVLSRDRVAVIVSYNLDKAETDGLNQLSTFVNRAQGNGYQLIMLTASSQQQARKLMQAYGFDIDYGVTDETALKTIVRSNPGVILLNNGTITAKSHWNDLDQIKL